MGIENINIQYESKIGQKVLEEVLCSINNIHLQLNGGIKNEGGICDIDNKEYILSTLQLSIKLLSLLVSANKNTAEDSFDLNQIIPEYVIPSRYRNALRGNGIKTYNDIKKIGKERCLLNMKGIGRKCLIYLNNHFAEIGVKIFN